jgi:hypothetical protein
METACLSEKLVPTYDSTGRQNPEELLRHPNHRENLKPHKFSVNSTHPIAQYGKAKIIAGVRAVPITCT